MVTERHRLFLKEAEINEKILEAKNIHIQI